MSISRTKVLKDWIDLMCLRYTEYDVQQNARAKVL